MCGERDMERYYKRNENQFSSRFSIENILKKEDNDTSKKLSTENLSYHDDDFGESWRRQDFLRQPSDEFYTRNITNPSLYDDRKQETEYWLRRNDFQRPRSLPLLTSVYHSPMSSLSSDIDVIPSPLPTSPSWSPSEVINRQTMESWFLNNISRSPSSSHYSHYTGSSSRRSPERVSPYSRSWSSTLSSEREGYIRSSHIIKPTYLSPTNDDDLDDNNRKGGQVRFSHTQSSELERVFSLQKYITPQERKQLSRTLDLTERQVKTWFQNRRAKWRRIKLEDEMRARMTENCLTRLSDDH